MAMARHDNWHPDVIDSGRFRLMAFLPGSARSAETLTVYLEGDGFAWFSDTQPSEDPTPLDPVGLRLALAQPKGAAAYLARPCQYVGVGSSACHARYWTGARFAPEVVAAVNQAISELKRRFAARHLNLVGYSGGAALALLVAARRSDVSRLVAVAGNVDPSAWVRYHRLSPLDGSLDTVRAIPKLRSVRQWYFVGARDRNTPPELAKAFAARFPAGQRPKVLVERGLDHHSGWVRRWPDLWHVVSAGQ